MADFTSTDVHACLASSAEVKLQTATACSEAVIRAAEIIVTSLKDGGKLMFCGNGGSAGDSQHLAAEFVATLDHRRPRHGLAALALTTDTSFLTAYANDFGFEGVFARQVETLGRAGDVLVAISTSGNSANIVAACEVARKNGIRVCAMTGEGGGRLADHADVLLAVPSQVTMHIQESHIALGHVMTLAVERMMDL
ncbi:MAG: SIS domain-containing protein [Pseudomonadota bacterium]|nr:SIS domain-containing protein [Pseudomonadota bacterium]